MLGSLPVMCIGLAQTPTQFILARVLIGTIGAAFVITQYHTSVMFAPNVVGAANATTAGWGNLGGGVTQAVMPLLLAATLTFVPAAMGWRVAMVVPGLAMLITAAAYWFLTQDAPEGNYSELRARGEMPPASAARGTFMEAIKDSRVIALFFIYAACFGIELTINGTAALYFFNRFRPEPGYGRPLRRLFRMNFLSPDHWAALFQRFYQPLAAVLGGGPVSLYMPPSGGSRWYCHMGVWRLRSRRDHIQLFVQMCEGQPLPSFLYVKREPWAVAGIVELAATSARCCGFSFRREPICCQS